MRRTIFRSPLSVGRQSGLACLLAVVVVLVAAGWTDVERAALDAAVDRTARLDEGPLYPLLRDAVTTTAPREPDWTALRADPAAHRGERFTVNGRFLVSEPMDLARSGPWGDAAWRWVVQVGPTDDDVAVVIVAAGEGAATWTPRLREPVTLDGRFYKLWTVPDMAGEPWDFPVFVAPLPRRASATASGAGGTPGGASGGAPGGAPGPIAMAVVVLLVAFISLVALQVIVRSKARHRRAARQPPYDARPADAPRDLPEDPAAALDALARKRDEAAD